MKEHVKRVIHKTKQTTRELPEKKRYFEFISAILSIPVLLTVLLLNVNGLKSLNKTTATVTPSPGKEQPTYIYVTQPGGGSPVAVTSTPKPTDTPECIKQLGPISIDYPSEGATVSDNPLTIAISYQKGNYCSAVWSYRINGGNWSSYDTTFPSFYNLPSGKITFDLRVKSLASDDTKTLQRTFTYVNTDVTPTSPPPTITQ